jgi:hypothetical protein
MWSGLVTSDGRRWRQLRDGLPLIAEDRSEKRFGSGSTAFVDAGGGAMGLQVRDSDAEVDLEFTGFYDAMPVWNSAEAHDIAAQIAPNHGEASGRAVGTVRLGDQRFEVDALFHRDHSWGPRDWSNIVSHRWFVGTFGRRLSFSAVILQGPGYRWIRSGAVVRHGEVTHASSVDIVPFIEADGVSHRGGETVWTLETGEILRMRLTTMDGVIVRQQSFLAVEGIGEVRLDGSDEVGFCDLEMSNGVGHRPVTQALSAVAADGLTRR